MIKILYRKLKTEGSACSGYKQDINGRNERPTECPKGGDILAASALPNVKTWLCIFQQRRKVNIKCPRRCPRKQEENGDEVDKRPK